MYDYLLRSRPNFFGKSQRGQLVVVHWTSYVSSVDYGKASSYNIVRPNGQMLSNNRHNGVHLSIIYIMHHAMVMKNRKYRTIS